MNYKLAQIKEMAKIYREIREVSIKEAVYKANEAYDIFRDAEFEVQWKSHNE